MGKAGRLICRFHIPRLQRGSQNTAFPVSRPLPAVKRNVRRSPPAGRSKDDGPVTVSCYATAHAISAPVASLKNVTEGGEILDNVAS